ncbi:MAG: Asp-tRNA(Asn)/Glu-tRNA(Gln) amidotransferase subunit GatB, partial [Clostridia bacterium]|nr:Asp-tRNA(Asn)/Glu-tRNA(Gln) amidotransferase subunit GatB [Clostridia bacterium]
MNFQTVIGLEIHCELKTKTKIFCSCKNKFGGAPNTNCCPACSGHPGTLPVLNKKAVEYAVMAGIALNCKINKFSKFDRKNYFYPDLPKAYQVSQFDMPICSGGNLTIDIEGQCKQIRINRIHLEEDAGKLIHSEWGSGTLVDYNRGGVPLIEIVTEPDMNSPQEAIAFLENIKNVLKYSGVSDCKMEEGSIRCDVNLSLKKIGDDKLGTRTEMKNLNSFKSANKAMQYEIKRQSEILSGGGKVLQETRRRDDNSGKSYSMRSKEDAQD